MYRREVIDKKILELHSLLATTDEQLTATLVKMAIESFEAERDALLQNASIEDTAEAEYGRPLGVV